MYLKRQLRLKTEWNCRIYIPECLRCMLPTMQLSPFLQSAKVQLRTAQWWQWLSRQTYCSSSAVDLSCVLMDIFSTGHFVGKNWNYMMVCLTCESAQFKESKIRSTNIKETNPDRRWKKLQFLAFCSLCNMSTMFYPNIFYSTLSNSNCEPTSADDL